MTLTTLKALAAATVVCCFTMGCTGTGGAGSGPMPFDWFTRPREPYVSFELLGLVKTSDGLSASVRLTPHGVPKGTRVSQMYLRSSISHHLVMLTEWEQSIVIALPGYESVPPSPDEDFVGLSAPYTEVRVNLGPQSTIGIVEVEPPGLDPLPAGQRVDYTLMDDILATRGDNLLKNEFNLYMTGNGSFVLEGPYK